MPVNWVRGLALKSIWELRNLCAFLKLLGFWELPEFTNIWPGLISIAIATHCTQDIETLNLILHMHDGILAMYLFAIL